MAAADVDDRARNSAKIHTVHHAPATDARAVADRRGDGRAGPWLEPSQKRRLRILLGTQPLEDVRVHPDAVTRCALQEADRPDLHTVELLFAAWAGLCDRLACIPGSSGAARVAERRACEPEGEAGRATDRCQPRPAVWAAPSVRIRGGAAIGAMQSRSVSRHGCLRIAVAVPSSRISTAELQPSNFRLRTSNF